MLSWPEMPRPQATKCDRLALAFCVMPTAIGLPSCAAVSVACAGGSQHRVEQATLHHVHDASHDDESTRNGRESGRRRAQIGQLFCTGTICCSYRTYVAQGPRDPHTALASTMCQSSLKGFRLHLRLGWNLDALGRCRRRRILEPPTLSGERVARAERFAHAGGDRHEGRTVWTSARA